MNLAFRPFTFWGVKRLFFLELTTYELSGEYIYLYSSCVLLPEDVTHTNIAMWFSPDGKYLCFAHSNDTSVIWFPYMWYGPANKPYTTVKRIAYPKPGTPNPLVSIKLVDLHAITFNSSDIPKARVLQPPQEMLKG